MTSGRRMKRRLMTGSALLLAAAVIGAPGLAAPQPGASQDARADSALIEELVAANRILGQQGIFDGFGHVSVRHGRDPNRYLLSRSLAPGTGDG